MYIYQIVNPINIKSYHIYIVGIAFRAHTICEQKINLSKSMVSK